MNINKEYKRINACVAVYQNTEVQEKRRLPVEGQALTSWEESLSKKKKLGKPMEV